MATTDIRKTYIGIVNEVQDRLGLDRTTRLDSTKFARTLSEYLNDVVDEVSDHGDWPQLYREWIVTAQSSVGSYEIVASAAVGGVLEIVWDGDASPLEVRSVQDIRRLQRISSFGTPRQFAIVDVSGVNPNFRVYPVPTTAATFEVAGYKKPAQIDVTVTANGTLTPPFPARMLIQGLYAKALLEENGGEPSPQYQVAYTEYMRMRREALNRWTADTGRDIRFVPTGRY